MGEMEGQPRFEMKWPSRRFLILTRRWMGAVNHFVWTRFSYFMIYDQENNDQGLTHMLDLIGSLVAILSTVSGGTTGAPTGRNIGVVRLLACGHYEGRKLIQEIPRCRFSVCRGCRDNAVGPVGVACFDLEAQYRLSMMAIDEEVREGRMLTLLWYRDVAQRWASDEGNDQRVLSGVKLTRWVAAGATLPRQSRGLWRKKIA